MNQAKPNNPDLRLTPGERVKRSLELYELAAALATATRRATVGSTASLKIEKVSS